MTNQPAPGYWREADSILYVTSVGTVYFVQGPDDLWPVWWEAGLWTDSEPTALDAGDFEAFERSRVAHGIPS